MELHFIADDLEEHAWYVDLVADFVEDVARFAASVDEGTALVGEVEHDDGHRSLGICSVAFVQAVTTVSYSSRSAGST